MAAAETGKMHVSLNVTDVEKSVEFYELFFGEKAHKIRSGYANFDLQNPPLKLALNQSRSNSGGPLNHLGIVLDSAEEVAAARARLGAARLISLDEGDTVCCHARQDKVWASDPDGNAWEIYAILDDMQDGAFEAPPSEKEPIGCCTPASARGKSLSMMDSESGSCCS